MSRISYVILIAFYTHEIHYTIWQNTENFEVYVSKPHQKIINQLLITTNILHCTL